MNSTAPANLSTRLGCGRVLDRLRLIEQEKNPLRRCHGGLHDIVFLGQVADRLVHALNVLEKRHQHASFDGMTRHLHAAVPEQQAHRDRAEQFDDRKEHGVVANTLQQDIAIVEIDLLKAPVHPLLLTECLHRRHTGDVFLQTGIEPAENKPALAIDLAGAPAIKTAQVNNHRKRREADQRQLPVEPKHHHGDAEHDRDIAHETDNAGAE